MAFPKKKYWIEAGDIKTKLPKQHDTGMFRSLDEIVWDILKCCGWDCCTQAEAVGEREAPLTFENGVTRTSNTVKLGGLLTGATVIESAVGSRTFTVYTHEGTDTFNTAFTSGGLTSTVADAAQANILQLKPGKLALTHTGTGIAQVGIGTTSPTSALQVVGLLEYADEAAAVLGGVLTTGAFYRTPTGVVMVKL